MMHYFKRSNKVTTTNESFSKPLYKNSNLLRLVLHRPIENYIHFNEWYKIDLKLVTEMGLLMDHHSHSIKLTCTILACDKNKLSSTFADVDHAIETRFISEDAWNPEVNRSEGFLACKPIGGIEYRIVNKDICNITDILDSPFYITVKPTSNNLINILPLTVGPIHCSAEAKAINNVCWGTKDQLISNEQLLECQQYRGLKSCLSNNNQDGKKFLIKEQWDYGTPGKIWDSAIVMTNIFSNVFLPDSESLQNKRILDLSAGTGYIGLSIAQYYQQEQTITSLQQPHILLTDLEGPPLALIKANRDLNHIKDTDLLDILPLGWGNKIQINELLKKGRLDTIIASDVLYNADHFPILIETLQLLSDQNTVIYLCYKQRGLNQQEEQSFFDQCRIHFKIVLLKSIRGHSLKKYDTGTGVKIYQLQKLSSKNISLRLNKLGQLLLRLNG